MVIIKTVAKSQASDFKFITFKTKPDTELVIKSVLEHFTYLKLWVQTKPNFKKMRAKLSISPFSNK